MLNMSGLAEFEIMLPENHQKIQYFVDPTKVEKRFGGSASNLTDYWPPRSLLDATKTLDEETLKEHSIIPFLYEEEEYSTYVNVINHQSKLNNQGN